MVRPDPAPYQRCVRFASCASMVPESALPDALGSRRSAVMPERLIDVVCELAELMVTEDRPPAPSTAQRRLVELEV